MRRFRFQQSIVTRLVASVVAGGLIVSAGLGVMELKHSETLLRMEMTQRVVQATRMLQSRLKTQVGRISATSLRIALEAYLVDPRIRAARVTLPGDRKIALKAWSDDVENDDPVVWDLPETAVPGGTEVDLDRITLVRAPFTHGAYESTVELLIDGPAIKQANRTRVLRDLASNWLFMAVMVLLGLMLLRRWFTGPLSVMLELITAHTGPESFYRMARNSAAEFSKLAEAIGGMLTRLENTTDRLRRREKAFESLYQHAPAAMISLDPSGRIIEANHRAAELLGLPTERILIGSPLMPYIAEEDRGLLRQAIDRLVLDSATRCELRVTTEEKTIHAAVECVGVRDDDGELQSVRLSLLDVSEGVILQRELADKSRLLNLVIDHMSDAILLVDADSRVAAVNQHLGSLLHVRPESLIGLPYSPDRFWDEIGVIDQDLFVNRLRQIDFDRDRPAQERFESRVGTFLFQGIPVHDTSGKSIGRLWVVAEITSQERNQKLLDQQTVQLQSLKRLGQQMSQINTQDQLLERVAILLFDMFGVEAMGIALRRDDRGHRSIQVVHRGSGAYLLEVNQHLVMSIEQHLMPQLLSNRDVTLWPDLPRGTPWSKAFEQAGLTTVAGVPLLGSADSQGIVWIARRGGERIERNHIYLLEALAPMLAVRLDLLQMREQMHSLHLTDVATDLPNERHFQHELGRVQTDCPSGWSALVIRLDHFQTLLDMLEHESADQLLRSVAVSLRRVLRKSCFVARLDGPIFGVISRESDTNAILAMANRLRQIIADQQITLPDGHTWRLTASIGLAICPEDGTDPQSVVEIARARMEIARRSGRDRVVADGPAPARQVG